MKLKIVLAVCAAVSASTAMAQTDAAKSGPSNNAVNNAGQNNSNAPVAGRNSFTEGQAKSRIEGAGYAPFCLREIYQLRTTTGVPSPRKAGWNLLMLL
jgi:hypothetical protein